MSNNGVTEETDSGIPEICAENCEVCGKEILYLAVENEARTLESLFCSDCKLRYPPSLLKATRDPFDYALKLRTGEVITFSEASICGEYATLTFDGIDRDSPNSTVLPYPFPRGLDVRIADIVWCADAPLNIEDL